MRRTLVAALAACAALGAAGCGGADTEEEPAGGSTAMRTVADELNFPEPVAEWIAEERTPSDADLIHALEGDLP